MRIYINSELNFRNLKYSVKLFNLNGFRENKNEILSCYLELYNKILNLLNLIDEIQRKKIWANSVLRGPYF